MAIMRVAWYTSALSYRRREDREQRQRIRRDHLLHDSVGQMRDPWGVDNPHQVEADHAGVNTVQQTNAVP
jgi:hypothetical protein